jgi:vacuolar-type H+-ATPase subunit H
MKAKKIFEKFQEETDPVADMGIGGVVLSDSFDKRRKQAEKELKQVWQNATKKWNAYLQKVFVGKTVTAEMRKLDTFDSKTMERKTAGSFGKFTIKVVSITGVETIEQEYNKHVLLVDEDRNIYQLSLDRKIYIR